MAARLLTKEAKKSQEALEIYRREEINPSPSKLFLTEDEALSLIKGRVTTNPISHYNYLDY